MWEHTAVQSDINSIAIIVLLLIILYFVGNFGKRFKSLVKRHSVIEYHNTRAKMKALEYSPSAIITINSGGSIIAWGGAAEKMFGYKEAEVLGKPLTIIIPEKYRKKHIEGMEHNKKTKKYNLSQTIDFEGLNREGEEFPIRLTLWQWEDEGAIFYTGIVKDITEDKKLQLQIAQLLEMYKRAEEIDDSGVWSWDILNDIVYTSKGFDKIYDVEDRDKMDSGYILKRVYYEDLPKVEANIQKYFAGEETTIQHRIVTRDGKIVTIEVTGEPQKNEKGEIISIIGTSHKV